MITDSKTPFDTPRMFSSSNRIHFQLWYARQVPHRSEDPVTMPVASHDIETPNILNVGCSDDPVNLGPHAFHFDMDDWSEEHEWFRQGDAHDLPFGDNTFHTVILGDILEHVVSPIQVVEEALRVCSTQVVLTIFEEWRLGPVYDQRIIKEGQAASDRDSQALGYADREDAQVHMFPQKVGVDDTENPHLCHIWQFSDAYIKNLFDSIKGAKIAYFNKKYENPHEGHDVYNWLVCLEKIR